MVSGDSSFVRRFKWHIVIICAALVVVVLLALFTNIFEASQARVLRDLVLLLGALIFISALLALVSRVFKVVGALRENSAKLEEVTGTLEKIRDGLAQINQSTRISDAAKAIAFRDADRQSLREAVFEKLQRHEFDSAYELIDEIGKHAEYEELAQQLRLQTDHYHDATNQERLDQGIAHIEQLFDNHDWVKASTQIEDLIRSHPDAEEAKAMRQRLLERKEQRKKELLAQWDEAVKRQETDRSLEILKELDLYLTPNEGLALQEAAKDVFRTKLHNLGVQFSMAVTERRWEQAVQSGEQIMRDFPNSKMADEIRERMEVLRQKIQ